MRKKDDRVILTSMMALFNEFRFFVFMLDLKDIELKFNLYLSLFPPMLCCSSTTVNSWGSYLRQGKAEVLLCLVLPFIDLSEEEKPAKLFLLTFYCKSSLLTEKDVVSLSFLVLIPYPMGDN